MTDPDARLDDLARARGRIVGALTGLMLLQYFGFIGLIAFHRELLAVRVVPGLSLGILLGASVIVISWILTVVYVRWANRRYDAELARLRRHAGQP
ncbi:MAG TPA: DUF485 domain-containing protein [Gemmatimonadales bacterium]|nr:DUF485 domain-containing protein [Gemmatimonadales bacterium]